MLLKLCCVGNNCPSMLLWLNAESDDVCIATQIKWKKSILKEIKIRILEQMEEKCWFDEIKIRKVEGSGEKITKGQCCIDSLKFISRKISEATL